MEELTVVDKGKKMMESYSLQFPDCPSISFHEVAALRASEIAVVLVDVRTKEV